MPEPKRVLLAMGAPSQFKESTWQEYGAIDHHFSLRSAAPSGRRLGYRSLGLGLDSLVLAIKARIKFGSKVHYICANPWTAVALRLLGTKAFSVIGIYAIRESRSWNLLRRAIASNPVLTLVTVEAEEWNADGGNAQTILYGNTFGYPTGDVSSSGPLSIFVGGTSDRDQTLLEQLLREIREAEIPVKLVVADGSGPRRWSTEHSTVEFMDMMSNDEFGSLMSAADIVFLPIENSMRAAGHMVTVGALECGLKVVTSPAPGMTGYVDGQYVVTIDNHENLLDQLLEEARGPNRKTADEVRLYWSQKFSLEAFASNVRRALQSA